MTTKRVFLSGLGALLLVAVALQFAPPSRPRYRADSTVLATPYTNALFARSFESHIVRTIPGVMAVRVTPALTIPASGVPVTNGVMIRLIGIGPTPEDAERAANEAAAQLCRTALTNYGVTAAGVGRADNARRYSYFHDTFQPAIGRLFKD